MHPNKKQQCSTTDGGHVLAVAFPSGTARPILLTVQQFSSRNPAFSQLSIRSLIFKAGERLGATGTIPGNGLLEAGAVVRIGRKVLIDEARFFAWVEAQQIHGVAK